MTKAEIGRPLRMVAALDETIDRLEHDGANAESIRRLRLLQGEILTTARLLEGDFRGIG